MSDWMHGVAFDAGGEVHLPTLTPPTDSELREASSVGYRAGKEADGSAEELAQKEGIDVDEVKVVYCEFFAGYLEDGEEETIASWLDDHFRTPPEKFEATRVDLEQISESTDPLPEKALETASVTVCAS